MKYGRYGEHRLSKAGKSRLEGYYVDQIWGVGSNLVDEFLLWSPLIISNDHPKGGNTSYSSMPGLQGRKQQNTDDLLNTSPESCSSVTSSSSQRTVMASAADDRSVRTAGKNVTRFAVVSVTSQQPLRVSNFLAPVALNTSYLLYLQDILQKYSRRGTFLRVSFHLRLPQSSSHLVG